MTNQFPREAIQPPPDQLLNYDGYVERLRLLSASPRVKIETIGTSNEGRGLHTIIIADEHVIPRLEEFRALAAKIERPQVTYTSLNQSTTAEPPTAPPDMRFPALVLAHTFGHEAAHLEGLLLLAERLAWQNDRDVTNILSKLIVVIYPLANPDGREAAIKRWSWNRLGDDGPNAGDTYGFYVNRDLLHLTQPEGEAVATLYRKWHPISAYDVHEDGYLLHVHTPEVCWAPAFGNANGGDIPDNLQSIVHWLSLAIIHEWDNHGYNYLRSDMFGYPMPGQSTDKPQWFASGNAISTFGFHGVPAVITESSRSPGAQTWEDRLNQKYTAGMALLGETARLSNEIVDIIYGNAMTAIEAADADAYVIPKTQTDPAALSKLVDVLVKLDIRVYQSGDAYIVPLAQAENRLVRELLSPAESTHMALGPILGLKVVKLSLLPANEQDSYRSATLTPVSEAPSPTAVFPAGVTTANVAVPNTPDGVRLLNRLWALGLPTYWLAEPVTTASTTIERGTFVVQGLTADALRTFGRGLALKLAALPTGTAISARKLHRPSLAVYLGQGVDRPDSAPKAEMWYAMEQLEFAFKPLFGPQVRPEWLAGVETLIVPDGAANEIVDGWQDSGRITWDTPGAPDGIGREGVEAIRAFVQAGGAYVGLGSGGGLLATAQYAGLIDLTVAHHSLGSARVVLRLANPANPLTYGLDGYSAEDGSWQANQFPAHYQTENLSSVTGGPIFKAGPGVTTVALYDHAEYDPNLHVVMHAEHFNLSEGGIAVAAARYGTGSVTVVGVRPGFRGIWKHSFKLITNAILWQASSEAAESITLA